MQPGQIVKPIQCTAHCQNGRPCRSWAVHGRTVCKNHGGLGGRPRQGIPQKILHSASFQARIDSYADDPTLRDLGYQMQVMRAAVDLSVEMIEQGIEAKDLDVIASALSMLTAQVTAHGSTLKKEAEVKLTDQAVKTGDLTLALTELPLAFADTLTAICEATGADLETTRELVKQAWSERMARANSPLLRASALPEPPK